MNSYQDLHHQNVDVCDLVLDLRSQGYFADYRLPCPTCGSQPDVSSVQEIGIKLHDDARLCHDCLNELIPGSVNLLEQVASMEASIEASSQPILLSGVLVALLNALSTGLKANLESVGGEING